MKYMIGGLIIGVALVVYGGYDDSPGAQLLGLILIAFGIYKKWSTT